MLKNTAITTALQKATILVVIALMMMRDVGITPNLRTLRIAGALSGNREIIVNLKKDMYLETVITTILLVFTTRRQMEMVDAS